MPVQRHPDTVTDNPVKRAHLHRTVQIGASGFDIFLNLRRIAREIDHHTIYGDDPSHALAFGDFHMLAQMAVFAMHRDQHLRPHDLMHLFQIRPVRVAGYVVFPARIIDHIHPHLRKVVHDANDALLIAGNGL